MDARDRVLITFCRWRIPTARGASRTSLCAFSGGSSRCATRRRRQDQTSVGRGPVVGGQQATRGSRATQADNYRGSVVLASLLVGAVAYRVVSVMPRLACTPQHAHSPAYAGVSPSRLPLGREGGAKLASELITRWQDMSAGARSRRPPTCWNAGTAGGELQGRVTRLTDKPVLTPEDTEWLARG